MSSFLATVALLAMLILVRMTMAQGADGSASPPPVATTMVNGSAVPIPSSGGSSIVLPAAALLLGSGILTYAFLRRR